MMHELGRQITGGTCWGGRCRQKKPTLIMKLGKKLAPENLIFHNMKNMNFGKKLAPESHIFHNMKLGKKLVPENLIFHNMKNKKLVKKLAPENPPKTGNFGTQQAFLNLVRMMEMILNQQESWQS